MDNTETLVRLSRNSALGYGNEVRLIIDNFDFQVFKGQIVAIVGPNGAGKSTLLKTLIGIIPLLKGELSNLNNLSYLPQDPIQALLPWYTSYRNIKICRIDLNNIYDEALKFGLLPDSMKKQVTRLSGGQKQKLGWLCTLKPSSEIVLLDEPYSKQDAESKLNLVRILRYYVRSKRSAIIVEHDPVMLARTADVVVPISSVNEITPKIETKYNISLSDEVRYKRHHKELSSKIHELIEKFF